MAIINNSNIHLYSRKKSNKKYGLYTINRGNDFIIPTIFSEHIVDFGIYETEITIPSKTLYTVINSYSNNADFGGSQYVVLRTAIDKLKIFKSKGTKLLIYCVEDNE